MPTFQTFQTFPTGSPWQAHTGPIQITLWTRWTPPNVRKITTFFPSPWLNLRTFGGLRDFAIRGCEHADGRLLLSIPVYLQCSRPQNPKKTIRAQPPWKIFFTKTFIKMHRSSAKTPICHISPVLKQNQKLIFACFLPKDSRNRRIQQYSSHPQNTPFCGEDASTPPVAALHYTGCWLNRT